MKKIDKKTELLKKLQAEIDRRTQVENEAICLISAGECEKACELLDSLDDQIVKDISAELVELDQDVELSTEQIRSIIKTILMDFFASIMISLTYENKADLGQMIQRYIDLVIKTANKEQEGTA